ncbi:ANTAR domain-containing protein [Nocardioides sp.]|uniref:ANTAR domain-containing protein n=1 Tax=Nocardioides sp. TaxID=35761 RepID=UPI00378416E5
MPDRSLLVDELSRFARTLVTDYPVSDALHDLVESTTAILGIHGAGTSIARAGTLTFVTAAPEDIAAIEEVQERHQVGPCIDVYRSGEPVCVADVTAERDRYPALAAAASSRGIVAIAAVPLQLNAARLGALDLYDTRPHEWTEEEIHTAGLLASMATGYIANASQLDQARQTAEQLQEALDSRVIIEQAKGVIAGERGITVDQAFQVLRAHARRNSAPLRDVANAVVHLGLRP